jgi:nucleotide-binding universal stress UspA family protein
MRVLVPYDGSDPSLDALEYAVDLFPEAEIHVLHVVDQSYLNTPYGKLLVGEEELRERAREGAAEVLAEAEEAAREAGVGVETAVRFGHPVRSVLTYADENEVDQIVIGGTGLSNVPQLLLGSVSFGVVLHTDVPVTIVR